jgi:hypothetical protein
MVTRISAGVLLAAGLLATARADDFTVVPPGGSHSCSFTFKFHNPPVLKVHCVHQENNDNSICAGGKHEDIDVVTNHCTRVTWEATDFKRVERDCHGNELGWTDTIPACTCMWIQETPHCAHGAPLTADPDYYNGTGTITSPLGIIVPNSGSTLVDSHRGGYRIHLRVFPLDQAIDICDDAGCYTSTITVTVTSVPSEDCHDITGTPTT